MIPVIVDPLDWFIASVLIVMFCYWFSDWWTK